MTAVDAGACDAGSMQGRPFVRQRRQLAIWPLLAFALMVGHLAASPLQARAADPIQAATISAGDNHTCAIRTSGQGVCWGENELGQLGDGTKIDRQYPTDVSGLTDAV